MPVSLTLLILFFPMLAFSDDLAKSEDKLTEKIVSMSLEKMKDDPITALNFISKQLGQTRSELNGASFSD
ncbi:MAG: hypothetical protein HYR96_03715 [Deltaproteobacteria bacterium]|nr:hypothetical protein [Deltaproteobacteria bacterium]